MNGKKWVYTDKLAEQSKKKIIGKEIPTRASKPGVTYRFKLRKTKQINNTVSL
jgi:hypothetical protein